MSGPPAVAHRGVHLVLAALRHPAVRVRDDHQALDAEQVGREHERAQHVVGDPCARVPQDLGVARPEAEHAERLDARVDAREHREAPRRPRREPPEVERGNVPLVGGEHVVEVASRPAS